MPNKENRWSRRDFFKTVAITGAGSLLAPAAHLAEAADKNYRCRPVLSAKAASMFQFSRWGVCSTSNPTRS